MSERKLVLAVVVFTVCILGALMAGRPGPSLAQGPDPQAAGPQTLVAPVLQYQGRILLTNGNPITDGVHALVFKLYTAADAPTAIWTETDVLGTAGGLFSTRLGDGTPLDPAYFNGQSLWLGIKVDLDPEAAPRQELLPTAYALSLMPGATISGTASPATLQVRNLGPGDALRVDGNLNVTGNLVGGAHSHTAYYTKSESEDRYVNTTNDAITGKYGVPSFTVTHLDTGVGVSATIPANIAVRAATGSTTNEMAGVLGIAGWTNTMLTPGGYAGVYGKSANGLGVAGVSDANIGVYGQSGSFPGVQGASTSSYGVYGTSDSAAGVRAISNSNYGLYATSGSSAGLYSRSTSSHGVLGQTSATSSSVAGVYGTSSTGGSGVYGNSSNAGPGVYGYSSNLGPAVQAYNYGPAGNAGAGLQAYSQLGWSAYVYGGGLGALYAGGPSTIAGTLTTQKVSYSSPRTHYWSATSETFHPDRTGVTISSPNDGIYGACITSGAGGLEMPVNLPDGAVVTAMRVMGYDNSTSYNLSVSLKKKVFPSSYAWAITYNSSGQPVNIDTTLVASVTIDNSDGAYFIDVWYGTGVADCSVRIKGVRLTYTVSEAE